MLILLLLQSGWPAILLAFAPNGVLMSTQKIDDFLTEGQRRYTPLASLMKQANNREIWTEELRALLPDSMRTACEVVALKGSSLSVVCRSAAVATRLRFLEPELVQSLSVLAHFAELKQIRVQVSQTV